MGKEDLFKKRILELCKMAYERDIVLYTDFLNLDELHMVRMVTFKGVSIQPFGGYEMSERQIAAIVPDALCYIHTYPITCLKITPAAARFADALSHRDYLGAILNLGINRNKIGDILVMDQETYVFCEEKIGVFLMQELSKIKHTIVNVEKIETFDETFTPKTQEIQGTIASERLDSVIALAFATSRSSMIPFIEGQKVFVNGKLITSNGYVLKDNDVISVRGKGKFRYQGLSKNTRKGRCLVRIEKYI